MVHGTEGDFHSYLQNIPVTERPKHEFQLYAMAVTVQPIKKLGGVDPPLVRAPPGVKLVPATSKVSNLYLVIEYLARW